MSAGAGRDWRPSASLAALQARARMLASIRAFFAQRDCLEVTTPVLAAAAATDPQIDSLALADGQGWLQSSPEFHMKRLLAAGSGPIWQISPVFRADEQGRWHNREFSLLEWYRPDWDHHALMDEVEALWQQLSGCHLACERTSYAALISEHLAIDLARNDDARLREALQAQLGKLPSGLDRDALLDAAMGLLIGPQLGAERPCFVYDYPASQAALARLGPDGRHAARFELYWRGVELANGFHELCDAKEQRRRFEQDLRRREQDGLPVVPLDEALIAALEHGLPDCAGVALGLDRLLALMQGAHALDEVIAFPADRA